MSSTPSTSTDPSLPDRRHGSVPAFVHEDLKRLGITLPDDAVAKLSAYLDLLLETNQQFNLTAIRDRDLAWRRHIVDSLTLLPVLQDLPEGAGVIDVGSGGGLPGLPVAIMQPQARMTLLEATGKKVRFLERCVERLSLASSVRVWHGRAEAAGQDPAHRQAYDVAVCRALGAMNVLLEYALPLVRVGGRVVAMKGPRVDQELDQSGDALAILGGGSVSVTPAYPDDEGIHAVLVTVYKDRPTPKGYPRPPGQPKQAPL